MRAGPVFCDSGAFIAFLDRSDRHHEVVTGLLSDPPRRWFTSLAVVAETYGWFLHRLGEDAAHAFRRALADLPRLERLAIDAAHHSAVERKLTRLRGHKLTYVDASSLVFLERLKIREAWGTDLDLALEGARVIPGGG